jgi:hypothetical protein
MAIESLFVERCAEGREGTVAGIGLVGLLRSSEAILLLGELFCELEKVF